MMARMRTLRRHRTALAIVLALCSLAAGFKLVFVGTTSNSDYESYLDTAHLFSGVPAHAHPERLLKPLAPLGVAAGTPIMGPASAFLFEMLVFYLALGLAMYALGWAFFGDQRLAAFGALLCTLSYPMLRYGVDLYTETGAIFFYVSSLWLTAAYLSRPSERLRVMNALMIGVGFLWKEYSVVAGMIFALALAFEQVAWRERVRNLALLAVVALIPTALVQAWVYSAFYYTYLDWYRIGGRSGFATQFTLHNVVKSFGALLALAWLLVPLGFLRLRSLEAWQKRFLLVAIPVPFVCLAWGFVSSRLFFVAAPAFILLALLGIRTWPRWAQYAIVALCIAVNVFWLVHNAVMSV